MGPLPLLSLALAMASPPDVDTPLRRAAGAPADGALVIGIEDYLRIPPVPYARRDATAFQALLVSTLGIPADRVHRLDSDASREVLEAALVHLGQDVGPDGTAWVFFAGHGAASPTTGERLLLGDDTPARLEGFEARSVPVSRAAALAGAGGGRVHLVLDTCFTGVGRDGAPLVPGARFAIPSWATPPQPGVLEWSAASPGEAAMALDAVEHGAFTWLVLGALRGWADGEIDGRRDEQVTAREAAVYVERSLPAVGVTGQHPLLKAPDPSLVLSRGPGEAAPVLVLPSQLPKAPQELQAWLSARERPLFLGLFPLEAVGCPPAQARALDLRLAARMRELPNIHVIPLPWEGNIVDVGQEAGVDLLLVGTTGTLGTRTLLNLELIDVGARAVSSRAYREGPDVDAVVAQLDEALLDVLVRNSTGAGPAVVRAVVQARSLEVKGCYEEALRRDPKLLGTVEFSWAIQRSGRVRDLALVSDKVGDPDLVSCIHERIGSWLFPAGSFEGEVIYPFILSP